jgi:hypothetical protein
MKNTIYSIIRLFFGIYMIWLGLINLNEINKNHKHIQHSINNYQEVFNLNKIIEKIPIKEYNQYIPHRAVNYVQTGFSAAMDNLNQHTDDLIYLMTFLFIVGGLLCSLGYSISAKFLQCAVLLDLFFIHSYFYYRDESMKVNVLKMLAILGGTFHVV